LRFLALSSWLLAAARRARALAPVTRYLSLVACLAFLAAAVAHGPVRGAEDAPDGPVTLRLSGLWGGDILPGKEPKNIAEKAERAVLEDFLKKHPGIRFEPNTGLRLEGAAAEAGLLMAVAGGSAGDVMYVNFRSMDQFVRQRFLYPLDEYVLDWVREVRGLPAGTALALSDVRPAEIDIHPQIWKVICRRGDDGRHHVYCLPYGPVVTALVYRKDLFREAGLDPSRPPQTWEELCEYADKLTDPGQGRYGFGMWAGGWQVTNFLWQGGSEVVVEGDDGVWRAVFNDDAAVGTLRYLRKLFCATKTGKDPRTGREVTAKISRLTDDVPRDFEERRCAMYLPYTEELLLATGGVPPEVMGMAALPAGPAGRANEINSRMWGMNSQIASRRQRDAAWAFIRHQASDDARRIITRVYVEGGFANMLNPAWLKKFGLTEYLQQVPKEWVEANEQCFKWGRPEPYGRNCQAIYLELRTPLDKVTQDPHAAGKIGLRPGTPEYEADTRELKDILDTAVTATNAKLLGMVPPEQLKRQRVIAWVVVCFIAVAFLIAGWFLVRSFRGAAPAGAVQVAGARTWRYHAAAWAFMALALASIAVWAYYPLGRGSLMAFQDYRVLGGSRWVGLDNFIEAYNQDDFWTGIRVTFMYVALSLGLGFVVPIILALLLNEVPRGKVAFRIVYYLPAIIPGLITMFLWKAFYDPTPNGMLNQLCEPLGSLSPKVMVLGMGVFSAVLLSAMYHSLHKNVARRLPSPALTIAAGVLLTLLAGWLVRAWIAAMWNKQPPFEWLNSPDTALLCVILPGIWAGAGAGSLIYLAALKAIPEEIYEAADLDGAGPLRKIWSITLPYLRPLIVINFVGAFIGAFHAMQNIFVMTGSGPLKSTHAVSLEIWMSAFMYLKYGYATAIAWILGAFLIGFTVWQLRVLREMKFTTGK